MSEQLDAALLEMLQAFVARAPLFAELRARGEADDVVQEALIAVRRRVGDGDVADPFAYATRVVQNLARRAYARERTLPSREVDGSVDDVAETVVMRFELAEVLAMVRAVTTVMRELPPADVELVRAELRRDDQRALARRLGMSRAAFYRRKRDVLCGFVGAVARGARAEPCPDRVEALLAAAGGSGFASARRAREHAESCAECSTTLRHLTAARHGFAVLTPLPALRAVDGGAIERFATAVHGALEWVRGVAVRGPDPSVVLPGSKGAAAAIAAACVGVGGTTYCAVDGVPAPVRDALGIQRPAERAPRPSGSRPAPAPPAAVAAARRGLAERPPVPAQQAVASRRRSQPRPRSAAETEFNSAEGGASTPEAEFAPSQQPQATAAAAPAAAPPPPDSARREFQGGGAADEFGR